MLTLYHDDLDGAASAAILGAYARERWQAETQQYLPVDYWQGSAWADALATDDFKAVVDFQFHPQADVWFDHHGTAFNHFGREQYTPGPWKRWDPEAPSCARLVYDYIREHAATWGDRFLPLVEAATLVDTAGYSDPTEYFNASRPGVGLQHLWPKLAVTVKGDIIRQLQVHRVEQIEARYAKRIKTLVRRNWDAVESLHACASESDGVVRADLGDKPFVRFAGFHCFPHARYAVTLFRAGHNHCISMSVNPWNSPEQAHHLGALARQYGGGGHARAAGITFSTSTDAIQAFWRVVGTLTTPVLALA